MKVKIKFNRRKILHLLIVVFGVVVVFVGVQNVSPNLAQSSGSVSYGSFYQGGSCQGGGGQETISAAEGELFDKGEGIVKGSKTIYKSSNKYSCCYEQIALGNDVGGSCDGVSLDANAEVDPWSVFTQGNYYASFGDLLTPNPGGYFGQFQYVSREGKEKISPVEFTYATKSNTAPSGASANDYVLTGYSSPATKPPALSNYDSWYEYLRRLVPLNVSSLAQVSAGSVSGSMSSKFGSGDGAYLVSGDLEVGAGTKCNGRFLVMVEGNLTINPSLTLSSEDIADKKACLFIVQGETVVKDNGSPQTVASGLSQKYDLVQMCLISAGEVTLEYENGNPLKVEGMLSGTGLNSQRDAGNKDVPSLWVDYDPRCVELFKQELRLQKFATREKGYEPKN